jgi:hypothetical protein
MFEHPPVAHAKQGWVLHEQIASACGHDQDVRDIPHNLRFLDRILLTDGLAMTLHSQVGLDVWYFSC